MCLFQFINLFRFTAMRSFFEDVQRNFATCMIPSEYLTVDETLYPMRNKIAFKVYNKSKPTKYGLLFKSLNSVEYPYTYQSHVYAATPVSDHTSHYINTIDEYVLYLIDKVAASGAEYNMKGCNITTDRLYTSVSLAQKLLDRGITLVGTWQSNRKGFPEELKTVCGNEKTSTIWYQVGDDRKTVPAELRNRIRLCSYVTKRKFSKKNQVVILTTTDPIKGVTMDDNTKKPALFKLYDYTKTGTDLMDQRMARRKYSTKAKSNKWTMVGFYYLLDTARINAQTVWSLNNGLNPRTSKSYEFGMMIAKSLILPMVMTRSLNGLSGKIRSLCYAVTGNARFLTGSEDSKSDEFISALSPSATRCRQCLADIRGKPGYSASRDKFPKIKSRCQKCSVNLCRNHLIQLCRECLKKS